LRVDREKCAGGLSQGGKKKREQRGSSDNLIPQTESGAPREKEEGVVASGQNYWQHQPREMRLRKKKRHTSRRRSRKGAKSEKTL